jgi:hypothetical protein
MKVEAKSNDGPSCVGLNRASRKLLQIVLFDGNITKLVKG